MPVEVVLRQVEQRRGVGVEAARPAVELEARQLQHPDLAAGARARLDRAGVERVGQRLSMVGPMLPAAATRRPARSTSSAVIAVVVVLPLVPVMADTFGA